jgi:hypothetical protein
MSIVTIELFDLTVSQAVMEVQRALESHSDSAFRIVLEDETHKYNVVKLLDKRGRSYKTKIQGSIETIEVGAIRKSAYPAPAVVIPAAAKPKPDPIKPVLVLSGSLGDGDKIIGRRLLLEIIRRADKRIPWIGIAHEGASLLGDQAGLKTLKGIQASGVPVRVSRECMMFHPEEASGFETMEDSEWQALLLAGKATKF